MDVKKTLEIQHSGISGNGTFTNQFIRQGTHIMTLTGKAFNKNDIDAICKKHRLSNDDPLQIDEDTMLILDPPSKTINHSCGPSAGIRHECDLYALRDINPGEEITYDYSTTVGIEDVAWQMPCQCGSNVCRKVIGNILTLPTPVLHRYAEQDALPSFIRTELNLIDSVTNNKKIAR